MMNEAPFDHFAANPTDSQIESTKDGDLNADLLKRIEVLLVVKRPSRIFNNPCFNIVDRILVEDLVQRARTVT
jgi:hypothetical protein